MVEGGKLRAGNHPSKPPDAAMGRYERLGRKSKNSKKVEIFRKIHKTFAHWAKICYNKRADIRSSGPSQREQICI